MDESFVDRVRDDFCLTADARRLSVDVIHGWLAHEAYWAKGRDRVAVETSLEHSYLYGILNSAGETVACARMITDHATFGWLCDVFVAATERGRGLGTWMVQEIVGHWMSVGVRRVLLGTRDAHEVYARVGFVPVSHPERLMQIDHRPDF
jgi:N-acetylglutamate synthase-like GNAT family acetyltransferase